MKNIQNQQQQELKLNAFHEIQVKTDYQKQDRTWIIKIGITALLMLVLMGALADLYNTNQSFEKKKNDLTNMLVNQAINKDKIQDSYGSMYQKNAQQQAGQSFIKTKLDKNKFIIPQNVWIFYDELKENSIFKKKAVDNIRYHSSFNNFTVNLINENNYLDWLSVDSQKQIKQTLSLAKSIGQIRDNIQHIKKQLISFHVLHENGGVLLDSNIILCQNFTWIQQIQQNPYVNKGNANVNPQYVAFFDINHGSPMLKFSKPFTSKEYQKYMIEFPGIETFFMAAVPKGKYLEKLLWEYSKLLRDRQYFYRISSNFNLKMGIISKYDIYTKGITIASHIVLAVRQFQISKRFKERSTINKFAIDQFGLLTINSRYFPKKISHIFENNFQEKIYQNLAIYTLQELEQSVGPLRYMALLLFQERLSNRIESIVNNYDDKRIHPHSFFAKYVLLSSKSVSQKHFLKNVEKPIRDISAPRWQALPKIVWLFWSHGFDKASIGNKVCIKNLIRSATVAGFEVRQINNSNIEAYIGKDLNERFDSIIRNHKVAVFPPTKSNFVRKAIIHKYGGVYLDVSYIALESLDWVLDIAQYPSQYVFNRYGALPKVLMFFHPHYGQPFRWTFDEGANTKRMELTAYENNFIIAEPNQALLGEWIEEYARFITSPYEETKRLMEQYHVRGDSWTNDNNVYLASMDSLKNVIGRKQNELNERAKDSKYDGPRSSAQFYGVWSISGLRGQQKIRINTNFDNSYYVNPYSSDNVFLHRYSINYTEGILGKANQMIKLYSWSLRHLTELIQQEFDSNFTHIHPQSYCMKYLIAPILTKMEKRAQKIYIND